MTQQKTYRIMVSGGGTGGHVYPAIAIAQALQQAASVELLFVGAQGKMEMDQVPEAGFDIVGLWISGIPRKWSLKLLLFPFQLISSLYQSFRLLRKFKPQAVVGVGGFASGPLLYMANQMNLPTLIQEQNSYPGITNQLLAAKAEKVCVAYPEMNRYFPKDKIILTGNPVRKDLLHLQGRKAEGLNTFGLKQGKRTVLVLGGSLGARTINEAVAHDVQRLLNEGVQVLWQTGKLYFEEMKARMQNFDDDKLKVLPFIQEMAQAYAVADVVVSRAGALSISELCLAGKPVVFVPSPNVAEDHQTKNVKALVKKQAAWWVSDTEAKALLIDKVLTLLHDQEAQAQLIENVQNLARPEAAEHIAQEIITLIK